MIQGVYYCDQSFIRFYKDGTYVSCLIKLRNPTEETFRMIIEWFDRDSDVVHKGKYTMKGNTIQFKNSTPFGERPIDYQGRHKGSTIIFETLNHNNGRKSKEHYTKVELKYKPKPRKKK